MTTIYLSIALKNSSVIVCGLFINALNVVAISGNTFQDPQTEFFPLPQKLETSSQPVNARITTGRALALFGTS